jgi:3-oxoacyl-[acyl-carrier protein] reductase
MNDLNGKVALVTGSSRGLGRSIAVMLAEAGADLVLNFRNHAAEAQAVEAQILQRHRRCVTVQADVSVAAEVEHLVRSAEERLGAVDILVNNAGIARPQPVEEITERDWDDLLTTNLKSCFLVTHAVLPGMRARQWGRIINCLQWRRKWGESLGRIMLPPKRACSASLISTPSVWRKRESP